jgi:hypothetical protein
MVAALLAAACGQSTSEQPGLILSRSNFHNGPLPSGMMILRNIGDEWIQDEYIAAAKQITVQLGRLNSDGSACVREGTGPASLLTPGDPAKGGWTLQPITGLSDDDVHWVTKKKDGMPKTKTYELLSGNVFHKAFWFDPAFGQPGIMTISGNSPFLQMWRESKPGAGDWQAETLWTANIGGREQRFRDVEVGDIDGDGTDELVIVTHDLGAVYVLEQTADGIVAQEISRTDKRTFVHEVEIGDIDGDGLVEFFTTPSEPNKLDGNKQAGDIDMFRWDGTNYQRTVVAHMPDRHAKEILVVDYDGDGKCELYAALEAEGLVGDDAVVILRQWKWDGAGLIATADIHLEGVMCRFLNLADTNGDGVNEIIASTRDAGIFEAHMIGDSWVANKIVPGYISGGFEHATMTMDWDGDGKDELFVSSDKQKKLRRFWHVDGKKTFDKEDIADFSGQMYLCWNIMPLPAHK